MKINFANGCWNTDDVTYAYSYRFEETPVFVQHDDCVENQQNSEAKYGFDNISLLSRKPYLPNTTISTRCSFEGEGAPLIVIADKLFVDQRGVVRYGDYIEVVLYQNGVNVWRMWMKDGKVTWKKLMSVEFPVTHGDLHELTTEISNDRLSITADGRKMSVLIEPMYSSFHLGINACEGINRFYEMTIEGPTAETF